ncbi:MAG: ATP-binding protein [Planctomycetota bacterium]|jgi:anti-sigma regulatory factor (Ser/Thr protein kinase)
MSTLVRDLTVSNDTANLQQVRAFVSDVIRESALTARARALMVLAADEAVTSIIRNAVRAAGGETGNGLCHVSVDVDSTRKHIAEGREKEIGIFLIRAIVDEINYTYRKGFQNQLEIVKFVLPDAPAAPSASDAGA